MQKAKIQEKKLYKIPSGSIIKVYRINKTVDKVFVYNYETRSMETFDYEIAHNIFIPMFTIGEVAKMLGKSPNTLRTYERRGLIDQAEQYHATDGIIKKIRLYSPTDVKELISFFTHRRGVGRPSEFNLSNLDKDRAEDLLKARFERNDDGKRK